MERERHRLRPLGVLGIYWEAARIVLSQRRLFRRVAAEHVVPLSAIWLFTIYLSAPPFSRAAANCSARRGCSASACTPCRLFCRLADDWTRFFGYKTSVIAPAALHFCLDSVAAVTFSVASIYSGNGVLSSPRRLRPESMVRCRLTRTVCVAHMGLAAYNLLFSAALVLLQPRVTLRGSDPAAVLGLLVFAAYLAGLVYAIVSWPLVGVVSVLEDLEGLRALRRSRALVAGKSWTAAAVFVMLALCFTAVEVALTAVVQGDGGLGVGAVGRLACGAVMWVALCAGVLFALVVQAVFYFVCKSYHHEGIDASDLSDRVAVYMAREAF